MARAIQYLLPASWMAYERKGIENTLLEAKASILALRAIPFQRRWVTDLQRIQLKMEVSGTSRIEGADFAGEELEQAIRAESGEDLLTRSQRQANAAARTYRAIAELPDDRPPTVEMIQYIHRSIVSGCDDDHCQPGALRGADHNATFGTPRHRGVDGGRACHAALEMLLREAATTFKCHDRLVQAIALHYHIAAMHPFEDGNGRTARAVEALMLQRAGLKDVLFIPMSNYYYDNKDTYLEALSDVRARRHDLTPFLDFALEGVRSQVSRLTQELRAAVSKELFRNLMTELFARLESSRKRVIVKRQLMVLNHLLDSGPEIELSQLIRKIRTHYKSRKHVNSAIARDINRLAALGAVTIRVDESQPVKRYYIGIDLDWPSTITDTEFFDRLDKLPKSKTYGFLTATGQSDRRSEFRLYSETEGVPM